MGKETTLQDFSIAGTDNGKFRLHRETRQIKLDMCRGCMRTYVEYLGLG